MTETNANAPANRTEVDPCAGVSNAGLDRQVVYAMFNAIDAGVVIVDRAAEIKFANNAFLSIIDKPRETVLGRPVQSLIDLAENRDFARLLEVGCAEPGVAQCCIASVGGTAERFEVSWNCCYATGEPMAVLTVTERPETSAASRLSRRQLRESERRLEAHLERTPLASIEWTLDRRARRWNAAAERIFGFTHAEVANTDAFKLIVHPESVEQVDTVWDALLKRAGGEASTNTNVTKDGRTILCRWYNTPLLDDNDRVIGVCSLTEDVTEREIAERELRASQKRLASVVRRLPVIVWALDERLVPVFWNEHAEEVTGFTCDEVIGNAEAMALLYPDDEQRERYRRDWAEMGYGDYDNIERTIATGYGEPRRVRWSNLAARCPIPGWSAWGIGVDITAQHEAKLALAESERRFRDVLESVDLAGVIFDRDGTVTYCNDYLCRLTGWPRDDILGSLWTERFVVPERRAKVRGEIEDAIAGRPIAHRSEGELLTRDGHRRLIVWSRSVLRNAAGGIVGATALGLDVTDQRRTEHELAAYRQQLERIVEERTAELAESHRQLAAAERLAGLGELAAGLGHDIGNVLLPIRCHLDALDATVARSGANRTAEAIRVGLEHLDRLADGLRLLARSPDNEPARLPPLRIEDWWTRVAPLVKRSVREGIEFNATIPPDLPPVRIADHHLAQAVLNLVLNASEAIGQAARDGSISLTATEDDAGMVTICVEDNGPGMPAEVRTRAFEPFFTTKSRGISTGMGLAVVHGIASRCGGHLQIESTEGAGTRVMFRLPLFAPDVTENSASTPPVAVVSLRDAAVRDAHAEVLRGIGFRVRSDDHARTGDLLITDTSPFGHFSRTVMIVDDDRGNVRDGTVTISAQTGMQELRALYLAVREERDS